jgi:hypothetical protein
MAEEHDPGNGATPLLGRGKLFVYLYFVSGNIFRFTSFIYTSV